MSPCGHPCSDATSSISAWLFTCQSGVLMGILSTEHGPISSVSSSGPSTATVSHEFLHTLPAQNGPFIPVNILLCFSVFDLFDPIISILLFHCVTLSKSCFCIALFLCLYCMNMQTFDPLSDESPRKYISSSEAVRIELFQVVKIEK